MNKKKIIVPLILILAIAVYFVLYHKDKTLKFVPKNADAMVLIDVKKLTRQYIFSFVTHPSKWSGSKTKSENEISLNDSGIRIPDFLQIFHLKDTRFSEWYSVIELKDPQKFSAFLKSRKFISKGKNIFHKDQIFIRVEGENAVVGTSSSAFENISQLLFQPSEKKYRSADHFIQSGVGSVSLLSGDKIQNFSIELKDDEIEINNAEEAETFTSVISEISKKNQFLEVELDARNIKNYARFVDKNLADSARIHSLKATADLEQVNDTIISYGYDDNFNEIETKTFQKIIQPNYLVDLETKDPGKTWNYFHHKKWINDQNQFTAIPFQPNLIEKNDGRLVIKSTRKPIVSSQKINTNYIFIRNSPLLLSSLSTLTSGEKKILEDIEYLFYGNKGENYWVKIKARNGKLPLILRW